MSDPLRSEVDVEQDLSSNAGSNIPESNEQPVQSSSASASASAPAAVAAKYNLFGDDDDEEDNAISKPKAVPSASNNNNAAPLSRGSSFASRSKGLFDDDDESDHLSAVPAATKTTILGTRLPGEEDEFLARVGSSKSLVSPSSTSAPAAAVSLDDDLFDSVSSDKNDVLSRFSMSKSASSSVPVFPKVFSSSVSASAAAALESLDDDLFSDDLLGSAKKAQSASSSAAFSPSVSNKNSSADALAEQIARMKTSSTSKSKGLFDDDD